MSNNLPITDISQKLDNDTKEIYSLDKNYKEFIDFFKSYVSADCWSIVANDEVLFNSYQNKSLKEKINDHIVRDSIINNPHSTIFCNLFRMNKDFNVIIYMFGLDSFSIHINYSYSLKVFHISKFVSKDYLQFSSKHKLNKEKVIKF